MNLVIFYRSCRSSYYLMDLGNTYAIISFGYFLCSNYKGNTYSKTNARGHRTEIYLSLVHFVICNGAYLSFCTA